MHYITIFVLVISLLSCISAQSLTVERLQEWHIVDFNFTSEYPASRFHYYDTDTYNGSYRAVMPAGIKYHPGLDEWFVSVPRWSAVDGYFSPATLCKVVSFDGPVLLLEPFPSFEANNHTAANGLRSVLGFEIDKVGNFWVLDQGRVDNVAPTREQVKLVRFSPDGTRISQSFIPDTLFDPNTSFLNDIVVDSDELIAYITDSGIPIDGETFGGQVYVYNLGQNKWSSILSQSPSTDPDDDIWIEIDGVKVNPTAPMRTGVDGIALSCNFRTLYITPLTSNRTFSIATASIKRALANTTTGTRIPLSTLNASVHANKQFSSDGYLCLSDRSIVFTSLQHSGIFRLLSNLPFEDGDLYTCTGDDDHYCYWPDTLTAGPDGVYSIYNSLHLFVNGLLNFPSVRANTSYDDITGITPFAFGRINGLGNVRSYVYGCSDSSNMLMLSIYTVFVLIVAAIGCCVSKKPQKQQDGVNYQPLRE